MIDSIFRKNAGGKTLIAQFSLLLGTLYPTLSILYHLLPATVIFFSFRRVLDAY